MEKAMTFAALVAILFILSACRPVRCEGDCTYSICDYKKLQNKEGVRHVPCLYAAGRELVRDVDCEGGTTIHICCRGLYRSGVQATRQYAFRGVANLLDLSGVTPNCTKRIFCEQSCKDGLSGMKRSDYPDNLADDSARNQEFVQAYRDGERQSCSNLGQNNRPVDKKEAARNCVTGCKNRYPECDDDMRDSKMNEYAYEYARGFHNVGMAGFATMWYSLDVFKEALKTPTLPALAVVKVAYRSVRAGMATMDTDLADWVREGASEQSLGGGGGRRRRETGDINVTRLVTNEKWKEFLGVYNETDPKLVQVIDGAKMNYDGFLNVLNGVNDTLHSYNFGPEEWNYEEGNNQLDDSFVVIAVIGVVILAVVALTA